MLCGLFNMAGFFIIITQNSEFSKNDRAATNPSITASLPCDVENPLLELFRRGENSLCESIFEVAHLNRVRVSFYFSVF